MKFTESRLYWLAFLAGLVATCFSPHPSPWAVVVLFVVGLAPFWDHIIRAEWGKLKLWFRQPKEDEDGRNAS